MTREDVIDGLKVVRTIHNGNYAPQIDEAIKLLEQTKWIPIKFREATEEEKEKCSELYGYEIEKMYDCKLPEHGENVLITTCYGDVKIDTFYNDEGSYFENYCDDDEVIAWMPLPQPYKAESEDKE